MKLISHRGNINGRLPEQENNPDYILSAIKSGFDVEVDVWYEKSKLYLGHDEPTHFIDIGFLKSDKLWCHCKNIDALYFLLENKIHCFFHDQDKATLTSQGYIWTYPGQKLTEKSICVMPEKSSWSIPGDISGICSDYISNFKEFMK